ncbi:hypothetical protein [Burkholderia sp. WSM2230]|uniref:hypothetical protein n=1 Tax=Burkholderia sp. WSM2230 TaxID=944435 RepID=UPI000470C22F|nr:hypothetical protein [Burkholderia sp. WSM2230]
MNKKNTYRIILGAEDWSLSDFYTFPHLLEQCYAWLYCLDYKTHTALSNEKNPLSTYPWAGGYSVVHAYALFDKQIHADDRPMIAGIKKTSPGWLDLASNVAVIYKLAAALPVVAGAVPSLLFAAKKAYKLITEINEMRRKNRDANLKATAAQLKSAHAISVELAKGLGYKNLEAMDAITGNEEISMKLLMAHYRRMTHLLEFVQNGKATFPTEESPHEK